MDNGYSFLDFLNRQHSLKVNSKWALYYVYANVKIGEINMHK